MIVAAPSIKDVLGNWALAELGNRLCYAVGIDMVEQNPLVSLESLSLLLIKAKVGEY